MDRIDTFLKRIKNFGQKPAITSNKEVISYEDLYREADKKMIFLQKNKVKTGDCLALVGDYSIDIISTLLGAIKNGNIVIPLTNLNDLNRDKLSEIGWHYTYISDTNKVQFDKLGAENKYIQELRIAEGSYIIIFTSGSTGKPKGVIHKIDSFISEHNRTKSSNLNILLFLLFDHIGGINTLFKALSTGMNSVICTDRIPEKIMDAIAFHQIHVLPTTPSFLSLLTVGNLDSFDKLNSLKLITYGAEPSSDNILKTIHKRLPNVQLKQTFGTTEVGILDIFSKSSTSDLIKFKNNHFDYKIINSELFIKSKNQAIGSISEGRSATDWISTGDYVEVNSDGFIKIMGNKNAIINVGGEKVSAPKIENVLLQLDFIEDCLVFSEKNPLIGEIVACKIVLKAQIAKAEAKSLIRQHCIQHLENYMVPIKILFVEKIEKTQNFKKLRPF